VDTDGRPCCGHNVPTCWQVGTSIDVGGGTLWDAGVRRGLGLSRSHDADPAETTQPTNDDLT